ncbi:unnamed protein product [Heligmosomoides polygyrus]|uniref:Capsid protein n=1 Tax=Heligmosomoides polygyrus TaxID=6339 RepID=A0A183FB25_HELPZ|nr:unnamed protein product [Heligmosomoides polygyrus]
MDYYWSVVDLNRNRQLPSGLVKSYTKLGPLLSGPNAPFPRVLSTSVDQKAINVDTDSVVPKTFIQDLWLKKTDWDTPLDKDTMAKWNDIIHGISGFVGTVPRYTALRNAGTI